MGSNCCRTHDTCEELFSASALPGVQVSKEDGDGIGKTKRRSFSDTFGDVSHISSWSPKRPSRKWSTGKRHLNGFTKAKFQTISDLSGPPGLLHDSGNADPKKDGGQRLSPLEELSSIRFNSDSAISTRTSQLGMVRSPSFMEELQHRLQDKDELVQDHRRSFAKVEHGIVGDGSAMMTVNKRMHQSRMKKSASVNFDMDYTRIALDHSDFQEKDGEMTPRDLSSNPVSQAYRQKLRRSTSVLSDIARGASMALHIMVENPRDIREVYDLSKTIGKGSFGVVKRTKVKATRAARAVKSIPKSAIGDNLSMLRSEMKISKMVDHPNLIKLYEIFEDALNLHLVLELCTGGHLKHRLKSFGCFSELVAAASMQQILRAVLFLHNNFICHRDLKPENVLILSETRDRFQEARLKVTDFGLSCLFKPEQVLKARVGTSSYMSPQVIQKEYNQACDLWSCGIIAYYLVSMQFPFTGKDKEDLFQNLLAGRWSFASGFVDTSQGALDFISTLLTFSAVKRPTAKRALHNHWLMKTVPSVAKDVHLPPSLFSRLGRFNQSSRFIQAACCLVASLLSKDHIAPVEDAFLILDKDGDGVVTADDIKSHLNGMLTSGPKIDQQDMRGIKKALIEVEKGQRSYSYTEFLAATFDKQQCLLDGVCRAAFSAFDQDCDGLVTLEELASGSLLGHLKLSELSKLVEDCDLNGDGDIDFDEFLHMMRSII